MATFTPEQIAAVAHQAGFRGEGLVQAVAIALAESGGRPGVHGDVNLQNRTWGPSIGLWQVRSVRGQQGTGQPRDASRLHDPLFNARAAFQISNGGRNFRPWSVHPSSPSPHAGASNRHLARARQAAARAQGTPIPEAGAAPQGFASTARDPEIDRQIKEIREQNERLRAEVEEFERRGPQEPDREQTLEVMRNMMQARPGASGRMPQIGGIMDHVGPLRMPEVDIEANVASRPAPTVQSPGRNVFRLPEIRQEQKQDDRLSFGPVDGRTSTSLRERVNKRQPGLSGLNQVR